MEKMPPLRAAHLWAEEGVRKGSLKQRKREQPQTTASSSPGEEALNNVGPPSTSPQCQPTLQPQGGLRSDQSMVCTYQR